MKTLYVPQALLAAGAGGLYWLGYGFWFGGDAQDRARAQHFFGWTDPARAGDYATLYATQGIGARYEALKNLASEWARSDPQRAVKLGMAGFILAAVLSVGLLAAIG